MSDWETTTRIGQKHKGGATPRETTVKGKSALNAAQRQGLVVGTDKKYASGNAAAKSGGSEGQLLTKVDRSDDIIKPKTVPPQMADVIRRRRNEEPYKMTQKELASKCNTTPAIIQEHESGKGQPNQNVISAIQRVLNVHLRGDKLGQDVRQPKPKPAPKK